jgi:hypothetical protein
MNEIKYPSVTTYFISYDDDYTNPHYGEVNSDQYMITPKLNMFTTTIREEFVIELLKFNINYDKKSTYGIIINE